MTAVTVTASATEDQSVFWRPSAALQVAHKPTKKRSLAASLLAAISALTLLLGLAGPASASTAPDSETAVAAQTDPTQAFVAAGGLETPATVRPNGSFGYDGVLGCCVAPSGVLDDALPNTNPFDGPVDPDVFVVDSYGTVLDLVPGESLTGSPDGMWVQVRGPDGSPTGVRLDGPHKPASHPDVRAQVPHAHVPGVTNADGTPWLPRRWN